MQRLTEDQFAALAELLRMRDSPSREAARKVLVEGEEAASVAEQLSISQSGVSRALMRCRRGLELVRRVRA